MRAVIGMLVTGPLLIGASAVPVAFVIALVVFLMFLGFVLQTLWRQFTVITVEERGLIVSGPWVRRMAWGDIRKVRLKYFSTKKSRTEGWMEMILQGDGRRKLRIGSNLEGFDEVATAVARNVEAHGVVIDEISVENFNGLGIETKSPGLPEAAKKVNIQPPSEF